MMDFHGEGGNDHVSMRTLNFLLYHGKIFLSVCSEEKFELSELFFAGKTKSDHFCKRSIFIVFEQPIILSFFPVTRRIYFYQTSLVLVFSLTFMKIQNTSK